MNEHRVAIGYCHAGTLCQPFVKSLLNMSYYDHAHEQHIGRIIDVGSTYVADARNIVVRKFLESDSTWLLFFDHDMVFAENIVSQFVELAEKNPDKLVIGGLYFNYLDDGKLWSTWMEPVGKIVFATVTSWEASDFKELSACGMGGTLIHRSVFERIQKSHSEDSWPWYAHDLVDIGQNKMERLGEDITFCWRAKQESIKIWGYTGITLGHIKPHMEDLKTFAQQPWVHYSGAAEHNRSLGCSGYSGHRQT